MSLATERSIRLARRPDGERIAYTAIGSGPPIIRCPGANSHLELMWDSPLYRYSIEGLAREHTVVLYDRHGCGLSDRERTDFSVDDDLIDLLTVMNANSLNRVPIIGASVTGPIAIVFAARYPDRVSSLVLYGAQARVKGYRGYDELMSIRTLGKSNPALATRIFTERLYPLGIGPEVIDVFRRLHASSTPEVMEGLGAAAMALDVSDDAGRVSCPTLVLHRRDDQACEFRAGLDLAMLIPSARFVPLEGNVHLDMGDDWLEVVLPFLKRDAGVTDLPKLKLSRREIEVLRLVAKGSNNHEIAGELGLSASTVAKHVTSILAKTESRNRAEATGYAYRRGLV